MDIIAQLLAVEEIRTLKARYFRFMDTKDWDALATVFAPDMQVISPGGEVWMQGGPAFAASLQASLEHAVSAHQGFTSEVEVFAEDEARGVFAMQDVISWPGEHRHPRQGWKSILGRGHYHDTFRRLDGGWRMSSLRLTRISLETHF